jgi:hypothetical protein
MDISPEFHSHQCEQILTEFKFKDSVTFEWSHDCSKPRTDTYGGGAAVITKAGLETMNTSEWIRRVRANRWAE